MYLAQVDWEKGQVSGTVYNGDPKLTDLMSKVISQKDFCKIWHGWVDENLFYSMGMLIFL